MNSSASALLHTVPIDLGDRSYAIHIGTGLLDDPRGFEGLGRGRALIVTNTVVAPLYVQRLIRTLEAHHDFVSFLALPDGEAHKTAESLDDIYNALLSQHADRDTVLYALGGGVVGDMTGFAAACYMRGVAFVQVPTTLLSQVDSSVGGKTAINHPLGKNMIGAFHQPRRVVADLDTLRSLPAREVSAGLAEVIKYGAILDAPFLSELETHMHALRALDPIALAHAVRRSCEFKAQIVGQDERESGVRALLNFGHTFGHAIETGLGYGEVLHGEAVGVGMLMAASLSARLGLMKTAEVTRLQRLVDSAGLPTTVSAQLTAEEALALMRHDKKAREGEIRFVLLQGLGKACLGPAPDELVLEVLVAHGAS